jgi:hypothetical protein
VTEGVAPDIAQNRQAHGGHHRENRGPEESENSHGQCDQPESVRPTHPQVTEGGADREKCQQLAASAGSIRQLAPKRLGDHAHERRDRQNQAGFRARKPCVFFQKKAKVGIKYSQRAEVNKPKKRQGNRMPHQSRIASAAA